MSIANIHSILSLFNIEVTISTSKIMVRTVEAKRKLRETAEQMISNRQDLRLAIDEVADVPTAMNYVTGGDKSGDICGVVIDKKSDEGYVQLFHGTLIATGPSEDGYEYISIPNGRGFVVYGSSAVLYIYHQ
ncbi:hypothetical protein EAF04_005215 [Stromatinia cepivora]|nr:hypothetical protein EAF04_005215 [Stromatinia cepivora]